MHNSLHIRDLLRHTNADPLRLERRDPHRLLTCDPAAVPGADEYALQGVWQLDCALPAGVAAAVQADLADLFPRLGLALEAIAEQTLRVELAPELGPRSCRLDCAPGRIAVSGSDVAGVWAGIAWLEWEMRTRRGAIVPLGVCERHAAWPVQISQGPWGGNYSVPDLSCEYLSDDAFRLYAHYGVNSMMIYGDLLCYVNSTIFPELNTPDYAANIAMLQDAAQRAALYGVQFSYVVVGPKLRASHPLFQRLPEVRGSGFDAGEGPIHFLCSSHPAVLEFYRELFGGLFRAVPELAGTILIVSEESFYHCHMWQHRTQHCPRCFSRSRAEVVAELVAAVDGAVRGAQPHAWVASWVYDPNGFPGESMEEYVRWLPREVVLYQHIEKDELLDKTGYTKHVWDYSIDYTGPCWRARQVATLAARYGHRLFIKSECGIGLEVFQFPYVPAMQQLATKWEGIRSLAPSGVQQSWLFFGMFGSRAEELGLWAAYAPDLTAEQFLRRIAARDFGPEAVDTVLAAWESMSRSVRHIPCVTLTNYYIGPSYLGPCHPLVPEAGATIPDVFYSYLFYLQEGQESFSHKTLDQARECLVMDHLANTPRGLAMQWPGDSDGWEIVVREYTIAAAEAEDAWYKLRAAERLTRNASDRTLLHEETLLTELVYRTFLACAHTVRFLLARREFERTGDASARECMRRIALLERDNALAALPIYAAAPWLDLAERTDGRYPPCREMIAAKVAWIDAFLGDPKADR
jgi:hypothetical protein